jgi:hypothetical protein
MAEAQNAKRKNDKHSLGDFVMLHQPVHIPKALSKLLWCGPWKIKKKKETDYELTHIDSAGTIQCKQ